MSVASAVPGAAPIEVFDCDGHVAEPRSLFDDYADAAWRDAANAALHVQNFAGGGSGLMLEGRCIVRGIEAVTFAGQSPSAFLGKHWDDGYPGAFDPVHRLGDMDAEGIDRAMVFPSLLGAIGGVSDVALAAAMCRAYNRWMLDYCSTDPARLHGVAIVPLQDPAAAAAEAEWAAAQGFRCVMVRPCPYGGRTIEHPDFERFYAICESSQLVIGLHPFPFPDVAWSQGLVRDLAGAPGSAIQMADMVSLPIDNMLTMAWAMFGGVTDRHPRLNFSFLESNGTWVAMWIDRLESRFHRGGHRAITTSPREILARQCYISIEGDERALPLVAELIGVDRLVWASDFPHFDGHFPGAVTEALTGLATLPDPVVRQVLGANAARMYGL